MTFLALIGASALTSPWVMLVATALGYLLGSIPFGLLLTRAAGLGDVRKIGSGNIGATNVLRTGNKWLAAATLLLDGLKGAVAVWLVPVLMTGLPGQIGDRRLDVFVAMLGMAAGLGAFLGHIFPVWLGFKGGKGVATFIGALLAVHWPAGVTFCAIWLVVAFVSRYSSLASLLAAAHAPIALGVWTNRIPAMLFAVMTALLFWKHRENIARLINGTESRIGAKSVAASPQAAAADSVR